MESSAHKTIIHSLYCKALGASALGLLFCAHTVTKTGYQKALWSCQSHLHMSGWKTCNMLQLQQQYTNMFGICYMLALSWLEMALWAA